MSQSHAGGAGQLVGDLERSLLARLCHRCRLLRPLRARHCQQCDRCVHEMDHHCPWVRNCVGFTNRLWFLVFTTSGALTLLLGLRLLYAYYRAIGTLRDPLMLMTGVFLFNGLILTGALAWSTCHLALTNVSMSEQRDRRRATRSARLAAPASVTAQSKNTSAEGAAVSESECATRAEVVSDDNTGTGTLHASGSGACADAQCERQFDRGLRANVAEFLRCSDATSLVRTRDDIQKMFARYEHYPTMTHTLFSSDSLLSSLLYSNQS